MHSEIFSDKQKELLPYMSSFRRSFYLVGGTAIALYFGHRYSIDFEMFTPAKLNKGRIKQNILKIPYRQQLIFEDVDQLHLHVNEVKLTFFNYPYPVAHPVRYDNVFSMPSLISLAAMKAFALGRRAKWKDYVDIYFLLRDSLSIKDIAAEAETIFGLLFSEKLFREQLTFHADIDFTEEVVFLEGHAVDADEIKSFLTEKALKW
jgi:hypothetical protein